MRVTDENRHQLNNLEHMPFLKPRGRIIIGRSVNWPQKKLDSLRELNASLHYIELMTFGMCQGQ
jgi:hypothetical protein